MKFKYLAALLMLLALGCADQGTSTPAPDAGTDSTTTVEPAETEADLTKVSLTVTGMR